MAIIEKTEIDEYRKKIAEDEIRKHHSVVDFDTREYPVEVLVDKYSKGLKTDENEIFIPDYQREMAWKEPHQSKFIESVLIGLPIPYLFVADIGRDEENDGRLEIVDGSQRIRTLHRFLTNDLELQNLEKLESLNGFKFSDLPLSRQRRFKRRTLRMIELTEKANETVRRDIFERINTGSVDLEDMEKRRGIRQGPMLTLVEKCAKNELFIKLAPLTKAQITRRDREELVLRFFAYQAGLEGYEDRVNKFLNEYLDKMNRVSRDDLNTLESLFVKVMEFVNKYFPHGFSKGEKNITTPRVRFDAIAVGVAKALTEAPELKTEDVSNWLESEEFKKFTTSGSANAKSRIEARINFVKDNLLKGRE